MNKSRQRGITLIELLTVVVIIGILASIMIPSYRDSVRKARRAEAQGVILELAQWMERFYTENGRYDQDRAGTAVTGIVPPEMLVAPREGGAVHYNLALDNLGEPTYTITATPAGSQAGDLCGNLTFTQSGVKGVTASTVDRCW